MKNILVDPENMNLEKVQIFIDQKLLEKYLQY